MRGKSLDPLEAWVAPPQLKSQRIWTPSDGLISAPGSPRHKSQRSCDAEQADLAAIASEARLLSELGSCSACIIVGDDDDHTVEEVAIISVVRRRKGEIRAEQFGLEPKVYCTMLKMRLPPGLLNVHDWLIRAKASSVRDVDYIEWFAGVSNVHLAVEIAAYVAVKCDIAFDREAHDVIRDEGMLHSIQLVRRSRRGAGNQMGTVCSTCFFSHSSTNRYEFMPLGVPPRSAVVEGANRMVAFTAVTMLMSTALPFSFLLEQPATILMYLHPRMQQVAAWLGDQWNAIRTQMGAFGAPPPKPTMLYIGHSYVKSLARTLTAEQLSRLDPDVEMTARDEVTGGVSAGKNEKASQAHPVQYGQAVQAAFTRHDIEEISSEDGSHGTFDEDLCLQDVWADAGMVELCQWLCLPSGRLIY